MNQLTITFDFTRESVDALRILVDALEKKKPGNITPDSDQMSLLDPPAEEQEKSAAKSSAKNKSAKPKEQPPEEKEPEPSADEEKTKTIIITMTDVRAVALKFSKAGKQSVLKTIFAKYGAEKLSDVSEDKYPALMADLEAANE